MVEIKYNGSSEQADLAGLTLSEARDSFKGKLGIPNNAAAWLNGKRISADTESDKILRQEDSLSFVSRKSRRKLIMVGAVVLALIITGGVFARGFMTSTASLSATVSNSNFADVVQNTDVNNITWNQMGMTKSPIAGPHSLFDITRGNGFTGDISLTVIIANVNELINHYRALDLKLQLVNTSDNSTIDINGDSIANADDWALLTLNNGAITIRDHTANNVTIRLLSGSYIGNAFGGSGGSVSPQLFCEIAQ